MEILGLLHSPDVLAQQNAFEQIQLMRIPEVLELFEESGDIILLTAIDVNKLTIDVLPSLFEIQHRKASHLIAKYFFQHQEEVEQIVELYLATNNSIVETNFLIECLSEPFNKYGQVYELAVQEECPDFELYLELLNSVSQKCIPQINHFLFLESENFLSQCLEPQYIEITCNLLPTLMNKFGYKQPQSKDALLLIKILQYLLQNQQYTDEFIFLIQALMLVLMNHKIFCYELYVPYISYCVTALQNFNHYNCLVLVPSLTRIYECRPLEQIRNIYYEVSNNISTFEEPANLEIIYKNLLAELSIPEPVVVNYSNSIDQLTSELTYMMLKYIDKRGVTHLIQAQNYEQNVEPQLLEHEQCLYNKFNNCNPAFWLDWFGMLKSQIAVLFGKISILYPNLCISIAKEIVTESWQQLGACDQSILITQKDDVFLNFDISIFYTDTVITSVLKLLLNENDYSKQTMLNFAAFNDVVMLLLVDEFPQPTIMYKTIEAASQIPKYVYKNGNMTESQINLYNRFFKFLHEITLAIIEKMCQLVNFRVRSEEKAEQQQLFQELSEDTLALRRMIVTKLNGYMSSYEVNYLLTDTSEASEQGQIEFTFHEQMLECISYYKSNRLLTETETINLTLVELGILVNVRLIEQNHSITGQDTALQRLMSQILNSVYGYFSEPQVQASVSSQESFAQYFNISVDNYQLITPGSIVTKRKMLFKLTEALSALPKLQQLANMNDFKATIEKLIQYIQSFLGIAIQLAAHLRYMSPCFVYNNTTLKLNLLLRDVQQYTQVDYDAPQSSTTEVSYNLEWLENCIICSIQTLVGCGQAQLIAQLLQRVSGCAIPFSIQKIIFDKVFKLPFSQLDPGALQALEQALLAFLHYYYAPLAALQRIPQQHALHAQFQQFIESLPVRQEFAEYDQILNKTSYLTKEQIETAMQQVIQSAASSYLQLLLKFYYCFEQKAQIREIGEADVVLLALYCFIEAKPSKVVSLLQVVQIQHDASVLLRALLMHCVADQTIVQNAISAIVHNFQAFRAVCQLANINVSAETPQAEMKKALIQGLQAAGYYE